MRKIEERKTICWLDYIFFVDDLSIGLYGWTNWIRQRFFKLVDVMKKKLGSIEFPFFYLDRYVTKNLVYYKYLLDFLLMKKKILFVNYDRKLPHLTITVTDNKILTPT